ncbi:MAG: biotin/lipoyl-binding protein [Marinilabiliales bacterium]|nr:biotin/lipoyl-binding protein [Marinilabiliales bacterium]
MQLEFKVNGRNAVVKEISRDGNLLTVSVDGRIYEVDVDKVSGEEYSILSEGKSHNIEVIPTADPKVYRVNTFHFNFDVGINDAESRFLQKRQSKGGDGTFDQIRSPMPGKVVKVLVQKGSKVEKGETVVILSAMKMESEYKAGCSGVVSKVAVKEGDTVDGNQLLVVIGKEQK